MESSQLGFYRLGKQLGRGATAQVFEAVDQRDASLWALKLFHAGLWEDRDFKKRALSEFTVQQQMTHPNVVRVREALFDGERPAVVMELIQGESLEGAQARLAYVFPELSVLFACEILKALEFAHGRGLIHRDLKPANILIANSQPLRVLVSDFGLARFTDASKMTANGALIGSPDFMSPEQASGENATAQSDLFSVSSILYFLVTGTRPFTRHSPVATLACVLEADFEDPRSRNPKLSANLAKLIAKGLQKDPAERFRSSSQMRKELEDYLRSLGLGESFCLERWRENPTDFVLNHLQIVASKLAQDAELALLNRDFSLALTHVSHLSLVAPQSPERIRFLSKIDAQRRKKSRGVVWFSSLAIVLVLVLAGSIRFYLNKNARPRTEPHFGPALEATHLQTPLKNQHSSALQAAKLKPLSKARSAEPPGARERGWAVVRLDLPTDVKVWWDDKAVGPEKKVFMSSLGEHHLRLEKPGAQKIESKIEVKADEPVVIRAR